LPCLIGLRIRNRPAMMSAWFSASTTPTLLPERDRLLTVWYSVSIAGFP
jgi:hypothetical protein